MAMRSFFAALLLVIVIPLTLSAQGFDEDEFDGASRLGVVIGVRGGLVASSPRGDFPSLLVGNSTDGTGTIPDSYGRTGLGARYGLALLIPFTPTVGLSAEIGSLHYVASYEGNQDRLPTRFDVQIVQLQLGFQGNLYVDPASFARAGIRSVYLDGGFDIGLATVANRVESSTRPEGSPAPIAAEGSFSTSEPFRNLVALHGGVGMRLAVTPHLEFQAEASYSYALNPVFSSTVVRSNDFTVDNLGLQIGLGYRF